MTYCYLKKLPWDPNSINDALEAKNRDIHDRDDRHEGLHSQIRADCGSEHVPNILGSRIDQLSVLVSKDSCLAESSLL